ncbi:MAG TPA: FAD-dependent oxidoreductase [Pseudogracilibacillus sp.]|nr:FAD-dependent oxidoreductase [Pseudogracilibacillus sp.]
MKYVIIGGDAAGMSAAMQVLKFDHEAEITVLERGTIYSYGQCGLPYVISGEIESVDKLISRSVHTFRDKYGIDARINCRVDDVNAETKTVHGQDLSTGEAFSVDYDKLLVASGADPFTPNWEGNDLEGVHALKTIPDAESIMNCMEQGVRDVTIVGGGYIGLEMAEGFSTAGMRVRLLNRSAYVGKIFDQEMAEHIHQEAARQNIDVHLNEDVQKIIGKDKAEGVQTEKGEYRTDLVLVATGVTPNTAFLDGTGVKTGLNGAIQVNAHMETNVPDVYAAGDCALQYHKIKEEYDYIPLGTTANKQGRIAGMNMAGVNREFKGMTGTSILKFIDLSLGKTGLTEKEAEILKLPYEAVTVQGNDIAGYYPGAKMTYVKLVYRTDDFQLLGGQIIGEKGVDKRVDVLATALFMNMKVTDFEDVDLSYAPPYNGVWDPIQRAARKATR